MRHKKYEIATLVCQLKGNPIMVWIKGFDLYKDVVR